MMPWNSLVDHLLTGQRKKKEIEAESQTRFDRWLLELETEIEVFVKQVSDLDLQESEDRAEFRSLIGELSSTLEDLRSRNAAIDAPAEFLVLLEETSSELKSMSNVVIARTAYIGGDPFEQRKHEKRRKEREEKEIKKAREKRDEVAQMLQNLLSGSEDISG